MSKTYRRGERPRWSHQKVEAFRCVHCKMLVGPVPSGGKNRNHCPSCLYSRHVDAKTPGDRRSDCGRSMAPIGAFTRRKGEYVIVHRCLECGFERQNRIAADDNFDLVLELPTVEPLSQTDDEETAVDSSDDGEPAPTEPAARRG